jgi:hypothetical protein
MFKNIRIGNTELHLVLINRLISSGYYVSDHWCNVFLKYAWSTMGWYDKTHFIPDSGYKFTWVNDFTDSLRVYVEMYFNAIKNSNSIYWYDSFKKSSTNLIDESIPDLKKREIFKESFYGDLGCLNLSMGFDWKALYASIAGKSVGVVSPFAPLFKAQYENGHVAKISPEFKPERSFFYQYPYCLNNEGPNINTFETIDAWLENNREDIMHNCDVVIGAIGASGPIIFDTFHSSGKSVFYTGGELQLKFGVMGARWRDGLIGTPDFEKNKNSWIIKPPEAYIPENANKVENGCYW